jgi:hypothetical protein
VQLGRIRARPRYTVRARPVAMRVHGHTARPALAVPASAGAARVARVRARGTHGACARARGGSARWCAARRAGSSSAPVHGRQRGEGSPAWRRRRDGDGDERRATGDGDRRRDGCSPGDVARTAAVGTAAIGAAARGARQSVSGSTESKGAVGSEVRAVGTALSRQRFNPRCGRSAWWPCSSGALPRGPGAARDV